MGKIYLLPEMNATEDDLQYWLDTSEKFNSGHEKCIKTNAENFFAFNLAIPHARRHLFIAVLKQYTQLKENEDYSFVEKTAVKMTDQKQCHLVFRYSQGALLRLKPLDDEPSLECRMS